MWAIPSVAPKGNISAHFSGNWKEWRQPDMPLHSYTPFTWASNWEASGFACRSVTRISQENSHWKLSATSFLSRKKQMRLSSDTRRRHHHSQVLMSTFNHPENCWSIPQNTCSSQNISNSGLPHYMLGTSWPKAALQKQIWGFWRAGSHHDPTVAVSFCKRGLTASWSPQERGLTAG